jgi:hypothetical protein
VATRARHLARSARWLGDSVIVAVATAERYDSVATFDKKLANKLESFCLSPYF